MNYSDIEVICSICKRPPDGTYTVDENILPCGHHCDNLIEVVAVDVDLLADAEALAKAGAVLGIEARYAWEQSQNGKRATVSAKAIQDWEAALRQYREAGNG